MGGPGQVHLAPRMGKVLSQAEIERKGLHDDYLSVEHVLLAMAEEGGVLKQVGVTRDKLLEGLHQVRGNQRVRSQDPEGTYQALEKYGRDLTKIGVSRET